MADQDLSCTPDLLSLSVPPPLSDTQPQFTLLTLQVLPIYRWAGLTGDMRVHEADVARFRRRRGVRGPTMVNQDIKVQLLCLDKT